MSPNPCARKAPTARAQAGKKTPPDFKDTEGIVSDQLVLLQWQQGWKRIRDISKEAAMQQDVEASLLMDTRP